VLFFLHCLPFIGELKIIKAATCCTIESLQQVHKIEVVQLGLLTNGLVQRQNGKNSGLPWIWHFPSISISISTDFAQIFSLRSLLNF